MITSTTDRILVRAEELRHSGVEAYPVVADLLSPDGPNDVAAVAVDRTGRLDVLVNNAGMSMVGAPDVAAPLHETTPQLWDASLNRNLTTAFAMTKAAVPVMLAQSYGRIVMISSVSGTVMAFAGDAAYHAAKAGMAGLARCVAIDYAGSGITCNAVAPGWIRTGSTVPDELAAGAATPIGRCGRPEEVAHMAASLAAPSASYVTGQILVVDGGNSIQEARQARPS